MADNLISDALPLTHASLPKLQLLELRGNRLTTTASIRLVTLTELYLADNALTTLEGIASLAALKRLHVRGNRIASLAGFTHDMPALEYLNLRENPIDSLAELQWLAVLSKLRHVVLSGTPISAMGEYRLEPLVLVRSLARLDKAPFEEDEKNEAAEVR